MVSEADAVVPPFAARWPTLWLGGLVAGVLDMALATVFWHLRGVAPLRVMQGVAGGLLGRAAYGGGVGTALLGLALHLTIACLMVLAYDLFALRLRWLVRRPWLAGPLYGCVLYGTMTWVVVPLSAAVRSAAAPADWIVASVMSHVLLVGLPCALFVRSARAPVAMRAVEPASGER